ncbi:putative trna ribose methyltransferase, partial [Blastocladiella britannica]
RLDVIVCASLVELTTNLGGLARTSEIFGLRELTVHSKRVVDDPLFRSLAVSADRHLPIREVTRSDLPAWLRTMKREHQYSVVALEQTSASVPLERLTAFPQKVILLLGKEREGIPADLLAAGDIVDLCIEIPQLGVTRSLNVHNSAVILIWEY